MVFKFDERIIVVSILKYKKSFVNRQLETMKMNQLFNLFNLLIRLLNSAAL